MSIIPSEIGDALKKSDEESKRPLRESGEYLVEVTSVAIADNPTTWIAKALMVEAKFLDEIGGEAKVRIELAPCTDKAGKISAGKIKFLSWQLRALELDADELAFQLFGIIGHTYKARYTVNTGLDEDGNVLPIGKNPDGTDRMPNLNPHTGKPYVNRDLVFLEPAAKPVTAADEAEAGDPEGPEEGA